MMGLQFLKLLETKEKRGVVAKNVYDALKTVTRREEDEKMRINIHEAEITGSET